MTRGVDDLTRRVAAADPLPDGVGDMARMSRLA